MNEPDNDYLWDQSGAPDPEVERLERLLSPFRVRTQEPAWKPVPIPDQDRHRVGWLALMRQRRLYATVAFAVLAVVVALSLRARFEWRPGEPWKVRTLHGTPQLAGLPAKKHSSFEVGQVLTTDLNARARIRVAGLGVVDVEPNSRVRLIATNAKQHRIALDYGTISAHMWAPPFSLTVDTPSAALYDLGCAFTLYVEQNGYGIVHVTSGWIEFETASRSIVVPAGAEATTTPELGPGTPYFSDAPPAFKAAVAKFDDHRDDDSVRDSALQSIVANARARDAFTLLSLMNQLSYPQRAMVLDHLAAFVPIPFGYTRDDVLDLRESAMDAYWNALRLGNPKSWIMNWKDVLTY